MNQVDLFTDAARAKDGIGERQTVDRARHPVLGEGRAVYDNGPARFIADDGRVEAFEAIGLGGGRRGPPEYTWLRARTNAGVVVELETTNRPSGRRHWRIAAMLGGAGWISVAEGRHVTFEPDVGKPVSFDIHSMWVGLPSDRKAVFSGRGSRSLSDWITYEGPEVGHFVWMHERDAKEGAA